MLTVVLGPRTRLATALLASEGVRGSELLLVARDAAEATRLGAVYPAAAVYRAWEDAPRAPGPRDVVAVVCCALGLIHPAAPDADAHARAARRDLGVLEALLQTQRAAEIRVVLVSSVLALAPGRAQAYYAGWKCTVEGALSALLASHPRARLCVLYPGRLVERRSLAEPASALYTTYAALARTVVRCLRADNARRRIVGADARLWLAARGVASTSAALLGRP